MSKENAEFFEGKTQEHHENRSYSVDESGRRLSVTGHRVSVVDDVFGEIVEGGPNYRDVGVPLIDPILQELIIFLGRLAGHRRTHDENSNRPRGSLHPGCI